MKARCRVKLRGVDYSFMIVNAPVFLVERASSLFLIGQHTRMNYIVGQVSLSVTGKMPVLLFWYKMEV